MSSCPQIFISYCHEDTEYKKELCQHLLPLEKNGKIILWADDKIGVGAYFEHEIEARINAADVVVQIITSRYLGSEFILEHELPPTLKRSEQRECVMFPILAEYCAWREITWLSPVLMRFEGEKEIPIWELPSDHRRRVLSIIAAEIADAHLRKAISQGFQGTARSRDLSREPAEPAHNSQFRNKWVSRLMSPKQQLYYALIFLITLICIVVYLFILSHDNFKEMIKVDQNLGLSVASKKYLSPGDEELIRFNIRNETKAPHKAEIRLDEFGNERNVIVGDHTIFNATATARDTEARPIRAAFKFWSASFGKPMPARLGLAGKVDGKEFQVQEPLVYIAPVPKVAVLLYFFVCLTLLMGAVFFLVALSHLFKQLGLNADH